MTGKVSLEYVDTIDYLIRNSYTNEIKYHNVAFESNKNPNKIVEFILKNLI